MWNLAIDFGTSNTTGATFGADGVRPLDAGRDRRVPSVVLLAADGTWVVGREADNQSVILPERVERAPKRRVGKGRTLLLGGQAVPITSAVAALLGPHSVAARERHGSEPEHIVLTHPARWGPERIDVLRNAAHEAGFARVEFCPEPVAAAHMVDDDLTPGDHIAVYDLGGGTFDTCVVRRTEDSFEVVGLPGGTERIGGEDFDHRLYRYLGEAVGREDPAAWEAMQTSDDRRWQRAAADLLSGARTAKEQLSTSPRTSVYVGSIERDVTLTRDEFEALVAADVDQTVEEMARTIENAGLSDTDLRKVYLVGGSSRLPIVQQRMGARFGSRITTWDDPKGAVVQGAAHFSATLLPDEVRPSPAPGTAPSPPSSRISVNAPPPRTGGLPLATPGPAPRGPVGPTAPTRVPAATPSPGPAAPVPYAAPYGTPAPAAWAPQSNPGWAPGGAAAKPPGSDSLLYAWIGAGTLILCCLPGPAVGLYFANEAKKAGHPQGSTAVIVNTAALAVLVVGWVIWLTALAVGGSES